MREKRVFGAKEITMTAMLLAICIASQFFKNLSQFITGPILNTCIVLAVLAVNLPCAIILCIITPVTAYFIAASPVMMAVPGIILFIMLGNAVLAVSTYFFLKKDLSSPKWAYNYKNYIKAVICAALKAIVMGLTISLWLLPTFIPQESPLMNKLPILQTMFSLNQFNTASIGFAYAFVIWAALGRFLKRGE